MWPLKDKLAGWVTAINQNKYRVAPEIGKLAQAAASKVCGSSWTGLSDADYSNIVTITTVSSSQLAQIQWLAGIQQYTSCPNFH